MKRIGFFMSTMLLSFLIYLVLSNIFSEAATPAWQTPGATGTIRLGNYRVEIDNVVYISSYPCELSYETYSYKISYGYTAKNASTWTRSSARPNPGEYTINDDNTIYNRFYVQINSNVIQAQFYENNSVIRSTTINVNDKIYFDTDPTIGASEFLLSVLDFFFSAQWQTDTGRYIISFNVPLALQVGSNIWTWNGDRSTFYLYQSYDGILISILDQQNNVFPVIISQNPTSYHIETTISDEWGTKTDGWIWLVDIIQRSAGTDELDYYRFVVTMQETTINDLSAQLGELIGTPDQPIPPSVLIAEGVKQEISDTFEDANAMVGELTNEIDTVYMPAVETAADQQFTELLNNVSNEDIATMSTPFSWLLSLGILSAFIIIMMLVKVLVNAHRKMGD